MSDSLWLHFCSLWENIGKLPILSKNKRFSKTNRFKDTKVCIFVALRSLSKKTSNRIWFTSFEILQRCLIETWLQVLFLSLCARGSRLEVFGWMTWNFTSSTRKKHAGIGIYVQKKGIYHFWNSFKVLFLFVKKPSPCNPLTMPSWPSCLGSKQSNNVTTTLNMKFAKSKHIEMAIVSWFHICSLNFLMLDSVVNRISGISRLNTNQRPFEAHEMILVGSPFFGGSPYLINSPIIEGQDVACSV